MLAWNRRQFLSLAAAAAAPARTTREGSEVRASYGVVATEPPDSARAGARMLHEGGNAIDAAAAACLAACMLEPQMVDLGGYVLCAVVLDAKAGQVWNLDANSVSPAAATETMFAVGPRGTGRGINESEYQCSVRGDVNIGGPLAVGVPGVMGGIGRLHEKWGRLKWPVIFQPSLELLDRGFPYGNVVTGIRNRESVIRSLPAAEKHLMPGGKIPDAKEIWHRPDMAGTLKRLAKSGWRDFYEGELGRAIADHVRSLGGILTRDDMKRFEPRIAATYESSFRGARIHSGILSNGGLSVAQLLNMWECLAPHLLSDPLYWHQLIEAGKFAWRDRLRYLGDGVSPERFLSKDYAAGRIEALRMFPKSVDRQHATPAGASPGTVNISAADAEGNIVAVTLSHGGSFGSCVTVPGTGITLGHGMCRFDPRPGRPNSVGANKRPLNNVCPTIIRLPDRDVALGLRGGRRIVSVAAHLCRQIVEHGASGFEAVNAPRLHVEEQEPVEVTRSLDQGIIGELQALGHEVRVANEVAGPANVCERLKDKSLRGASNVWAVGVS
ncbi:MAG: gamma-glutamyltransferase [Bryobacteraceae bacterium]